MTEKARILGDEPAFPQAGFYVEESNYQVQVASMSLCNVAGCTKREFFSAMAMQSLISVHHYNDNVNHKNLAENSLIYADALLEKLSE